MSAANGRLSASELAPIPGGELRNDAAAAWNAPGGPADAGLRPGGPISSYRTYAEQEETWAAYQAGGNLAAIPGTSNHGWGLAVDIPNSWEQEWMRSHGAHYGWEKTEAFSEPWHFTYVPGVFTAPPAFKTLRHGSRGPRVVKYTRRLAYIHRTKGAAYLPRFFFKFKQPVVVGVKNFQRAYRLKQDGEIGPKTAAKINAVFLRQYAKRGKR
jgi:hypothetical protein